MIVTVNPAVVLRGKLSICGPSGTFAIKAIPVKRGGPKLLSEYVLIMKCDESTIYSDCAAFYI